MKHFRCLKKEIDVSKFLFELAYSSSWSETRARVIACQRETENIPLRELVPVEGVPFTRNLQSRKTEAYYEFPQLTSFLEQFAVANDEILARAMIVRLRGQGRVYPHFDRGVYYSLSNRFHLVLKSEGTQMFSGREGVVFRPGELWWFDNKAIHAVFNNNNTPRVHVIFDTFPRTFLRRGINFVRRHRADIFGAIPLGADFIGL